MAIQTYQVQASPLIGAVRILSIQKEGTYFILDTELNDKIKIRQPVRKKDAFGTVKPGDYFLIVYDPIEFIRYDTVTPEQFENEFVDYQDLQGV